MIRNSIGGWVGVLLLGAVLFTGCSSTTTFAQVRLQETSKRKAAPDFTLQDVNRAPVHLSDFKGKVVLLNFWATWCGPCKIEIPWFTEFERQYKDRGFAVLGIAMDDDGWPAVKPYLEAHNVNYRVMIGNDRVAELFDGVDALPTSLLIDREGRIATKHVGLVGKGEYTSEIESLLASDGHRQSH